ncbi:MAG TPA: alginate export family protein [Opitutaceae bacterium]|nr:alginate export family protein [Opitutaceae bacterium]
MKSIPRRLLITSFLAVTVSVRAQYTPPPPSRPFAGFINEYLRASDPYMNAWDIGANYRLRFEDKLGAGFTDAGSNWDFSKRKVDDNNNRYYLSRFMPRVAYTGRWFAAMAELRSSYSLGDERFNATAPGKGLSERDGPVDVHQAFVFVGNHKEFPLSLKIGRQELNYGDQRLVGPFRWNNNARTFDAAKLRWQNALFGVDLFTAGVVYNRNDHLNRSNPHDRFSGAYFNFPTLSPKNIIEAYFLARNVSRRAVTDNWSDIAAPARFPAPQDVYTLGTRFKSKPNAYDPWDYGVELMYQFGNRTAVFPATTVAAALAAKRLRQQAYAWVLQGGYTWTENTFQPRLALIYSYGSGDHNANDGKSTTFQNLFPTNHLFYGYMDLSSLQNLHDIRLACTLKPTGTSMLAVEGHLQYLATTSDYWYNVAGVPRNVTTAAAGSGGSFRINPSYGSHLGEEIDTVAAWTFLPCAQIEAAACHYFRGDYIKQSLRAVGSKDANYFYVQLTLNL